MADQFHDDARFLELLDKWQSGDFTRSDERELFELAGKDPFRQESLDGWMQFPETDHSTVLDRLAGRLQEKKKRRVILFPRLLSLAAALALLLGAIWFFSHNQTEVLKNDSVARTETPAPVQPEFSPTPSDKARTPERSQQPRTGEGKIPDDVSSVNSRLYKPERPLGEAPGSPAPAVTKPSGQGIDNKENKEQDSFAELNNAKTDELSKPVDRQYQSTNISPPEERASTAAKKKSAPKTEPAPATQGAVYGKTDSALSAPAADKKSPGAVPDQGWDAFGQYLRNSARLTPQAKANNVSGYVRVQFYVDITNRPVNFIVVKSLGYGCDEAAIDLVKNWKWSRQSGQPVLVDVPFVR